MTRHQNLSFAKSSTIYTSMGLISQIITFFREFLLRYIIPPAILGYWNFSNVVQSFLATFDLGAISGASRELPVMQGKHNEEQLMKIRSTTFWSTMLQNAIVSIFAVIYFIWNREHYHFWNLTAGYVAILIYFLASVQLIYITFIIAVQEFIKLGKLLVASSIIEGVAFPAGAYFFNLKGLMVAAVATSILKGFLFYWYARRMKQHITKNIHPAVLKDLLSFGFFLRLVDYPQALFGMVSILWVTRFMSIESLAFFSVARSFFLQISDISGRIGTVYSTRFLIQCGQQVDKRIIASELKRFLLFQLLVIVPLLSWGAGVIIPFIINSFIPKYAAANAAFLSLLPCGFFYVLNSGLTNPWVMDKKLIERGSANIFALFAMVLVISFSWFGMHKRTIEDIGAATVMGYFIYFVYMVLAVGRDLWHKKDSILIIGSISVSALWVFIVLHAGNLSIAKHATASFLENLRGTVFMAGWSFLAILPVPLYGLFIAKVLTKNNWIKSER